jgi:DNA polymerase-1
MGIRKLARTLKLTDEAADNLFRNYHKAVPFVKATMDKARKQALETGVVTTILGRRSTFDLWVPAKFSEEKCPPLPLDQAIHTYGRVQRAFVHKALNRILQGSAAELIKLAMFNCWNDGVFDVTGVPRLTVHDELDFSRSSRRAAYENEAWEEKHRIMTSCLPLSVPVLLATSHGANWGRCK